MKRQLSAEQKIARAEYARKWRSENPERAKEHARRTREKNKDKIGQRQREWNERNRERISEANRERYQANKVLWKESALKRAFGISLDDYSAMLAAQGGKCAICGSMSPGKGEYFAVDHDHVTGRIRKLLCSHCNVGLGHFRDDPELLERAAQYLRDHP